jgi:hypothetical protein
LFASLAPGGWLFTGASDPPLQVPPFRPVITEAGICYRRPGPEEWNADDAEAADKDGSRSVVAGLLTELPTATEGLRQPSETFGPSSWLGQETGHNPLRLLSNPSSSAASAFHSSPSAQSESDNVLVRIENLANVDAPAAERLCAEEGRRRPLDVDLHFLHAVLLIGLGRDAEAGRVLRRVLYLDRTLAAVHYILGSLLERRGDRSGACRAYQAARDLAAARPADEVLRLADGETAGCLAAAATARLAVLESGGRTQP